MTSSPLAESRSGGDRLVLSEARDPPQSSAKTVSFEKGHAKVGGRRRGTPNRLSPNLRAMVLEALHRAGGVDYLVQVATEHPATFLRLLGKLIPRQLEARAPTTSLATLIVTAGRSPVGGQLSDSLGPHLNRISAANGSKQGCPPLRGTLALPGPDSTAAR